MMQIARGSSCMSGDKQAGVGHMRVCQCLDIPFTVSVSVPWPRVSGELSELSPIDGVFHCGK